MRISPQSRFVTSLALRTLPGLVCQAGCAEDLSYRFVEVNFVEGELLHADSTRVGIAGSADFGDLLFFPKVIQQAMSNLVSAFPTLSFSTSAAAFMGP